MEHTMNEVTVKVKYAVAKNGRGIEENGRIVYKTDEVLRNYKEEEIRTKTDVTLKFETPIKKVQMIDGVETDVDTLEIQKDLRVLVPAIAEHCEKLHKCFPAILEPSIFTHWLEGATLVIEQTRYEANEIIDGTDIVADRAKWCNEFKSVTLAHEVEEEVDDFIKALQEQRKKLFLEKMLGSK